MRNNPSLWERQEHGWNHIIRMETMKTEAQKFPSTKILS
jgi:hypothetical protein